MHLPATSWWMRERTRTALIVVASALFLVTLTGITESFYQKTGQHPLMVADTVISGNSLAPLQYRILAPALVVLADRYLFGNTRRAERAVTFGSILLCFAITGGIFYRAGGSLPLAFVGLIALHGTMVFGIERFYRQEFLEITFVAGALYALYHSVSNTQRNAILMTCTVLGTLNRETFLFALLGMAGFILFSGRAAGRRKQLWTSLGIAFTLWALVMISVRAWYGLKPYYCELWMIGMNVENLVSITSPASAWYMGAGLLWAATAASLLGVRRYGSFILAYAVPMLAASFLFGLLAEHRIFYPLFFLLLVSLIGHVGRRQDVAVTRR